MLAQRGEGCQDAPKQIIIKVRKRAKIRNRYNQAPRLTQDTNGKVTTSHKTSEVSPFPAGDHKASTIDVHESITKQDRNNDPQKKHRLGTVTGGLKPV